MFLLGRISHDIWSHVIMYCMHADQHTLSCEIQCWLCGVEWAHQLMTQQSFCHIPGKIKLALCNPIFDPVVHVKSFRRLQETWALRMSWAVECQWGPKSRLRVSQFHKAGWGFPNSTKVLIMWMTSWAPTNISAVSASEAEAGPPCMVFSRT